MDTDITPDAWFAARPEQGRLLSALRRLLVEQGLEETVRWGQPAYTLDGHNVVLLGVLRDDTVVSFFRGALLDDPQGMLVQPGENSRKTRYLRIPDLEALATMEPALRRFLAAAMDDVRAGRRVPDLDPDDLVLIGEIQAVLDDDPVLADAFEALTPGRRRAYNLIVGQARQSATRTRRILSFKERILAGKGPQDCICGHSKRMPRCDGSHKRALPGAADPPS